MVVEVVGPSPFGTLPWRVLILEAVVRVSFLCCSTSLNFLVVTSSNILLSFAR